LRKEQRYALATNRDAAPHIDLALHVFATRQIRSTSLDLSPFPSLHRDIDIATRSPLFRNFFSAIGPGRFWPILESKQRNA
jgi:hypothetical protein